MTQHEINREVVEVLGMVVKELRRSPESQWWDDMPGLQERLTRLHSALNPPRPMTYEDHL